MNRNVHLHYNPYASYEAPKQKMSKAQLYEFAAECCRYTQQQLANEREYFIVGTER